MAKIRHPNSGPDDSDKAARRLREFEDAREPDVPKNDQNDEIKNQHDRSDSETDEDAGGAPGKSYD